MKFGFACMNDTGTVMARRCSIQDISGSQKKLCTENKKLPSLYALSGLFSVVLPSKSLKVHAESYFYRCFYPLNLENPILNRSFIVASTLQILKIPF